MRTGKSLVLGTVMAAMLAASFLFVGGVTAAKAGYYGYRQYYSSWSYYPTYKYYYRTYYYKPYRAYTGYKYHYCVHYPKRPRYVYYYNPYRKVYWGRYDLESQGYSLLAEKDRKQDLNAIPESAFPEPGQMPFIPESEGAEERVRIDAPSREDLPTAETPADIPPGGGL